MNKGYQKKVFKTHGTVMGGILNSIFSMPKSSHGSRHRKAQMKAMGRGRFTGKSARFGL